MWLSPGLHGLRVWELERSRDGDLPRSVLYGIVYLGWGHDHMSWLIVCCCHCGKSLCFIGTEDRSDSVDSVFCIPLFWLFERLSLPTSVFIRDVVFHGG
jgi:hypothetical protein